MRVRVDRLVKRYGPFRALDDVSLDLEPGQLVAVLGQNGAGKTTLLRCLAAVASPSSGSVRLDDEVLSRSRVDLRRRLFFLTDVPFLHATSTPIRHIGMVARLYGRDQGLDANRVWTLLEDLDLVGCARAPAANLSRGEAYKTALAALMVAEPELAILDEPFASGMDPHGMLVFKRWARTAADHGAIVVYSTQILEIAEALSDRVAILDRGKLHIFGSVADLRDSVASGGQGVLGTVVEKLRQGGA